MILKKRLSKIKNYWYCDAGFRKKMYFCISSFSDKNRIFTKFENNRIIRNKYSEIKLSADEISCFHSGFLFNSSSSFDKSDMYSSLSYQEINIKNLAINDLGKELGFFGIFPKLYSSLKEITNLEPQKTEEIQHKIMKEMYSLDDLNTLIFSEYKVELFYDGLSRKEPFRGKTSLQKLFFNIGKDFSDHEISDHLKNISVLQ